MKQEEINKLNRDKIFYCLSTLGVTNAILEYQASHKDANISLLELIFEDYNITESVEWPEDKISFTQRDYKWDDNGNLIISVVEVEKTLPKALEDLSDNLLDEHHEGWARDAGSSGSISYSVENKKIKIKHTEYYESSDYSEREI